MNWSPLPSRPVSCASDMDVNVGSAEWLSGQRPVYQQGYRI
jgi:hypothetical protein